MPIDDALGDLEVNIEYAKKVIKEPNVDELMEFLIDSLEKVYNDPEVLAKAERVNREFGYRR
jgi:hypothetical protein